MDKIILALNKITEKLETAKDKCRYSTHGACVGLALEEVVEAIRSTLNELVTEQDDSSDRNP